VTRSTRLGLALVAALGAFVFFMLVVGSLGEPREELQRLSVAEVLGGEPPVDRFGGAELRISGWYAELDGDCVPSGTRTVLSVPWLERECPLRVLLPEQPSVSVSQAELLANGLLLAAPNGRPFPSRAQPEGPNLRLEQLVFIGHFDDPAAAGCQPDLLDFCRSVFVVSDYDGLIR
jgi:hypothetical protein